VAVKRGPGPLAAVAILFLLGGAAFVTIEIVQRTRFNNHRLNVQSCMLGIETHLRFDLDKNGSIQIPEAGRGGIVPQVAELEAGNSRTRISFWKVSFMSGGMDRTVMTLTLVQERTLLLRSPYIVLTDTRDCDRRTLDELRLRLSNQRVMELVRNGF